MREEEIKIFDFVFVRLKTTAQFISLSLPSLQVLCESVISRQGRLRRPTTTANIHTLKNRMDSQYHIMWRRNQSISGKCGLRAERRLLYVYMSKCWFALAFMWLGNWPGKLRYKVARVWLFLARAGSSGSFCWATNFVVPPLKEMLICQSLWIMWKVLSGVFGERWRGLSLGFCWPFFNWLGIEFGIFFSPLRSWWYHPDCFGISHQLSRNRRHILVF